MTLANRQTCQPSHHTIHTPLQRCMLQEQHQGSGSCGLQCSRLRGEEILNTAGCRHVCNTSGRLCFFRCARLRASTCSYYCCPRPLLLLLSVAGVMPPSTQSAPHTCTHGRLHHCVLSTRVPGPWGLRRQDQGVFTPQQQDKWQPLQRRGHVPTRSVQPRCAKIPAVDANQPSNDLPLATLAVGVAMHTC